MRMEPESTGSRSVTLIAADGYPIAAERFDADGAPRGSLIVAGATAVPQGYYRRFAAHARRRGFTTLTLDYRGVGRSRPASLRGFATDFIEWATLDLAAAVDAMADDRLPLFMVGHSFGGHAFGLLPNHHRVARFCVFGTGAGWHGWMSRGESVRVRMLWNLVLPVLTAWKGYLPSSLLGLGEDLPLGVYRQWRHWCRFPHYFFDDPEMHDVALRYTRVRTPILAANAHDDPWAPPRSRDAFVQGYRNAPIERIDIDPARFGGIGHMGYFRPHAEPLWDGALSWLAADDAHDSPHLRVRGRAAFDLARASA